MGAEQGCSTPWQQFPARSMRKIKGERVFDVETEARLPAEQLALVGAPEIGLDSVASAYDAP